jgi:hypothetical protein
MAKNFPYFKFIATEWLTGDIYFEDFELQGLFVSICANYWQRDGELTLDDCNKRTKSKRISDLIKRKYIKVVGGKIQISFLDEQLIEAGHISKTNSKNGKLGGRPKKQKKPNEKPNETEIKPTAFNLESETKPNEKQIKEEEELEVNNNNNNLAAVDEQINYIEVHQSFADRLLLNDLECQAIFEVSEKRVTYELLNTFIAHLTNQSKVYNHYSEFKKHFSNWMRKHEPSKENKSKVDAYLENNLAAKKLLGI